MTPTAPKQGDPIVMTPDELARGGTEQPRQEFDLRYPFRTQPDGGPCWCVSNDEPHDGWVHSPLCAEMFRRWWAGEAETETAPDPLMIGSPAFEWFQLARDFTYAGPHDIEAAHAIVAEHREAGPGGYGRRWDGDDATDFPAMWAFVRGTDPKDHHYRCSWRTENGALLCDCAVIWCEYGRREARSALRAALSPEPESSVESLETTP